MKRTIAMLALALHAPLAAAAYRCVDERGLTQIGDTPPPGCANVPMYEITKTGKVLRKIDPTPTSEQLQSVREAQEKRSAELKAAAEQKRKDTALLASYGSPKEFDVARDRNVEPVNGRIAAAEQRVKDLAKREQEIHEQLEFYKGGKAARAAAGNTAYEATVTWYNAEIERVKKERAMLVDSVARLRREVIELDAKYEADKQRWIALKGGSAAPAQAAAPPARADSAAAAKPGKPGKPGY